MTSTKVYVGVGGGQSYHKDPECTHLQQVKKIQHKEIIHAELAGRHPCYRCIQYTGHGKKPLIIVNRERLQWCQDNTPFTSREFRAAHDLTGEAAWMWLKKRCMDGRVRFLRHVTRNGHRVNLYERGA